MTDLEIIEKLEFGYMTIADIRKSNKIGHESLLDFLEFLMDYSYGYNQNLTLVFDNYNSNAKNKDTWYYTALYIYHSNVRILPDSVINAYFSKSIELDKVGSNIYIRMLKILDEYNDPCDLSNINDSVTGYESYNFYNSNKSLILANYKFFDQALSVADAIKYKENNRIKNYHKALIYRAMGDFVNFEKVLYKLIEKEGHLEYNLLRASYYITVLGEVEKAGKILSENRFRTECDYYLIMGLYQLEKENEEVALELFKKAFEVNNLPEILFDYIWVSISMRKYENITPFINDNRFVGLVWFEAYIIVYMIEYEKRTKEAIIKFNGFNECKRKELISIISAFEEVSEILGIN